MEIKTEQSKDLHGKVHRIDGFIGDEIKYTFFIDVDTNEVSNIRGFGPKTKEEQACLDKCRLHIFKIISPEAYFTLG